VNLVPCQLQRRGSAFGWKKEELLRRVREGSHRGFLLKDGAQADMVRHMPTIAGVSPLRE
jgi:hypothetical protein